MTARRTLAIAAAALLCGVGDVLLVLGSEHFPDPGVWAVFGPVVGWSFVGTGLYAWRRRPESRFGLLMVLVGFAWFLGPLYAANSPLVFTLGIVASGLWGPIFGQLLLSFPTGRLPTRARRRLVAASYVLIPLAPVPALLVSDADEVITDCRGGCPRNVLLIERDAGLTDAALALGSALSLVLCLVAVGMLVRQWRAAAAPERRSLVPVFVSGGVSLALVAAYATTQVDARSVDGVRGLRRHAVRVPRGPGAGGPLRLARRAHAHGAARRTRPSARTCATPWRERSATPRWSSRSGCPSSTATSTPAGRPPSCPARTTHAAPSPRSTITAEHVAAIVHDRAQDTETVRAAGAATALMLENQRLDAELRARLVELRASRARLVEAADGERRRIERDLHDGAQSRLVALALNLRLARMSVSDGSDTAALLDGSIDELGQSLKELRDLARGIHPVVLSERGLEPAVRALAARAPVPVDIVGRATGRLPAAVETAAYFVVSEALTNVSKYAHAEHATVRVERVDGQLLVEVSDDGVGGASAGDGSGLRGLADRVAALSGTLEVSSPPGAGHAAASPAALLVSAVALRVVVAEDSFLLRAGVVRVLEDTGFVVVGEASDGEELLEQVREHRPDVVVTDIRMPPTHTDEGVRAAAVIRSELPQTGVVVLSQYVKESYAIQLLEASAAGVGYLLKDRVMEPRGFAEAVRQVARGGSALDPEVVAQMLDRRRRGGPLDELSERELDVLAGMAEGRSNAAIATGLGIGEHTLQRDVAGIFSKLELPDDAEGHRRVLAVLTYIRAQES